LTTNSKTALAAVVAGTLLLSLVSCSSDDGGTAPCENCGFWNLILSGVVREGDGSVDPVNSIPYRYPDGSVDEDRVAFAAKRDSLGNKDLYSHILIAGFEGDTTRFYQITDDAADDFRPAWSPDGQWIAFERYTTGTNETQIFVVDVSDPESPGEPIQMTTREEMPHTNGSPSWSQMEGETWISFCSAPRGLGDSDVGLVAFPGEASLEWVTIDPSDIARQEQEDFGDPEDPGVMTAVFKDLQASSNGTNLVVFQSPDREPVCDIRIVANTEEQEDSSAVAAIYVNEKFSNLYTPFLFSYRPAGLDIRVAVQREDYCVGPTRTIVPEPDVVNTYLMEFVRLRGTLAISGPEGKLIFIDGERQGGETAVGGQFREFTCQMPGEHTIYLAQKTEEPCSNDTTVTVTAGQTTYVTLECPSRLGSPRPLAAPGDRSRKERPPRVLAQGDDNQIWLLDMGENLDLADDVVYLVGGTDLGISAPVLSPDGKYIAYFRGGGTAWELVVADITALVEGSGSATEVRIGLPGSSESFECWRKPEALSWRPLSAGRKVVASMSICRGGELETDYEIWEGDLSSFLPD
jgi:hypothetical protein